MEAKRYLQEVGAQVSDDFVKNRSILSFEEYVTLFMSDPRGQSRNAAQYLRDVMDHYGTEQVPHPTGKIRRFKVFDVPASDRDGRAVSRARRRCRTPSTGCSATSRAPAASTSSSCCTGPTAARSPRSSTRSRRAWRTTRASPRAPSTASAGSSPRRSSSRAPSASAGARGGGRARRARRGAVHLRAPGRRVHRRAHPLRAAGSPALRRPARRAPAPARGRAEEEGPGQRGRAGRQRLRPLRLHACTESCATSAGSIYTALLANYKGDYLKVLRHVQRGALLHLAPLPGGHGDGGAADERGRHRTSR